MTTPTTPAPDSPWTHALARLIGALDTLTDANLDEAELLRVHHDAFGALTEAYEYGVQTGIDRAMPAPVTLEAIPAGLTAEQAARGLDLLERIAVALERIAAPPQPFRLAEPDGEAMSALREAFRTPDEVRFARRPEFMIAVRGCDDCSSEPGEPHHPTCPRPAQVAAERAAERGAAS